jgi:hypothetical protein
VRAVLLDQRHADEHRPVYGSASDRAMSPLSREWSERLGGRRAV